MDSYYDPQDLDKFAEIGKNSPELAKKYFDYYGAVFAEGALTEREKALIARRWPMRCNVPTASTPTPVVVWKRVPTWKR